MAYTNGKVIALQGAAPHETGAHTTSDLLVEIAWDDSDEVVGDAVLRVVNSYGERPAANNQPGLLKALGVTSYTGMTRSADAVSISLVPPHHEIRFSPWRRHPPGGWVGHIDDPHFSCPPENVPAVGRLLRKALEAARDLPAGN